MRLHVVDGTFELYRAHFSPRPSLVSRAGEDGEDRKAVVGLCASLLSLLHEEGEWPTHLAVAFDNPIRSFRNDLFEPYKSDEGVPPELRAQFNLAEEAARAVGVRVWSMDRFEADDAIGSAVARFGGAVDEVRILSPDKDFGQCLTGGKVVVVDRMRRKETREADFLAQKGFAPASLPDFLALTGDTADGIPGVPGFGEKTAGLLLGAFGRLESIPEDPATWPKAIRGAARLAPVLAERRQDALLYRTLATLRTDAPIDEDLEALRFRGVPREALAAFAAKVGADRPGAGLGDRVTRWA